MAFKSAYPTVRLGDVVQFVNGDRGSNYPKEQDYQEVGVPFISAVDIATGTLDLARTKKISLDAYHRLRNGKIQKGDLLYCLRGSIGKSALVRGQGEGAIASSLVIIRGSEHVGTRFVQYVMNSPVGQGLALRLDNGSVQPNISVRDLRQIEFPLPPVADQQDILASLGSIDDRIENVRQTNATLEAIAQALFKAWFVDFDPVRAKAEGREPEGMDAATAALFPSEFEDSELGSIPRGWRVESLIDAFEINPKRTLKKGSFAKYLDMASVPTTGHVPDAPVDRTFASGSKFANGDTLFARITPCLENGKTAHVDFLGDDETAWGSTEFIVLRPRAPLPPYFGYLLARQNGFRTFAIQAMSGTSGRQRVEIGRLEQFRLPVPDAAVAIRFGEIVEPIRRAISQNAKRAETLGSLRDTLLPRLISGKLRLPEAKPMLKEAIA
jgi:type I restriction enzyme, S subunit